MNRLFSLLLLALLVSGCATHYGAANISSNPDGAEVVDMEDGSVVGVTSVEYLWKSKDTRRKFMNLRLQKEGYQDVIKSFWLNLNYASAEDARKNPQQVTFDLIKAE